MSLWFISPHNPILATAEAGRLHSLALYLGKTEDVYTLAPKPRVDGSVHLDYVGTSFFYREKREEGGESYTVDHHHTLGGSEQTGASYWLHEISFALVLLKNLFRKDTPKAIIHSTPSLLSGYVGWLLSKRFRCPFILDMRAIEPTYALSQKRTEEESKTAKVLTKLMAGLIKISHKVMVPSVPFTQKLQAAFNTDHLDFFTLPAFSTQRQCEESEAVRESDIDSLRTRLQVSPLSRVVMYYGRHDGDVGLIQFLQIAKLLERRSDFLFLLCGEGSQKQKLKEAATGLKNLRFISVNDASEKWLYLKIAALLVLPQDAKAHNYVAQPLLTDYLTAARPVVMSGQDELTEKLKSAGAGLGAQAGDAHKLAYSVLQMMDNPPVLEAGRKAAFDLACQEFNLSNWLPSLEAWLFDKSAADAKPKTQKTEDVSDG